MSMARPALGRVLLGTTLVFLMASLSGLAGIAAPFPRSESSSSGPSALAWTWTLTNPGGFGSCQPVVGCENASVESMESLNSTLYAGTANISGAEIWQKNASTWSRQVQGGLGDPGNSVISAMARFAGRLYAGTQQNESAGAELWSTNGITWTRALTGGFDPSIPPWQPKNSAVTALLAFGDHLYIGTRYAAGAEIWAYDGIAATQVVSTGLANTYNVAIVSLSSFGARLYAGTLNGNGAEVWRSPDGVQWTRSAIGGFNDSANTAVSALAVVSGTLYAGTTNAAHGAEIWRSADGDTWERILSGGFGNPSLSAVNALLPYKGMLYAAVSHSSSPAAEVWAYDGQTWQRAVSGGLPWGGQTHSFYKARSLTVLNDVLYLGTSVGLAGSAAIGPEVWSTTGPAAATPSPTPTQPAASTTPTRSATPSPTATQPAASTTPTRSATPSPTATQPAASTTPTPSPTATQPGASPTPTMTIAALLKLYLPVVVRP
jgi:hypothetical protein